MTSEINGLPPIHRQINGTGHDSASDKAAGNNTTGSTTGDDRVSLTDGARQLQALQDQLKDLPEVDTKRVESIRAAIEAGTYQIDANRVAEKMMQFEETLG